MFLKQQKTKFGVIPILIKFRTILVYHMKVKYISYTTYTIYQQFLGHGSGWLDSFIMSKVLCEAPKQFINTNLKPGPYLLE